MWEFCEYSLYACSFLRDLPCVYFTSSFIQVLSLLHSGNVKRKHGKGAPSLSHFSPKVIVYFRLKDHTCLWERPEDKSSYMSRRKEKGLGEHIAQQPSLSWTNSKTPGKALHLLGFSSLYLKSKSFQWLFLLW